jgi:hypothetical protein
LFGYAVRSRRRGARDDRAPAGRRRAIGEPEHQREVRARGIAHHRDPLRIDRERARVRVQPRERGAHVVELGGVAVLGREPVVDVEDGIARAAKRRANFAISEREPRCQLPPWTSSTAGQARGRPGGTESPHARVARAAAPA